MLCKGTIWLEETQMQIEGQILEWVRSHPQFVFFGPKLLCKSRLCCNAVFLLRRLALYYY